MITDLSNLTQAVKENRLKNLAINIVKYQKFKTPAIIAKIDNAGYSKSTLITTIAHGIAYIKHGTCNKKLGNLTKYIDEAIENHIQPLTPAPNEYRNELPSRKKNKKQNNAVLSTRRLPVQDTLEKIYQEFKNSYSIAIQVDNDIHICKSMEYAKVFSEGIRFAGKTNIKIIKITIEDMKND